MQWDVIGMIFAYQVQYLEKEDSYKNFTKYFHFK